jgi:class 3 adenylate cyclase
MERRLAAILLTDIVGYSRLMGLDENRTIARQSAHRQEVFDPKISEHGGRIVKSTGDGLLVEFASVVDAVTCAVETQNEVNARDAILEFQNLQPETTAYRYISKLTADDAVALKAYERLKTGLLLAGLPE